MLGRIRRNLTRQSVNIVYKLLIRPVLDIAIVFGVPVVGEIQSLLELLQGRASAVRTKAAKRSFYYHGCIVFNGFN